MTDGNSGDETTDGNESDSPGGRPGGQESLDLSGAEDQPPEELTTDSPLEQRDEDTTQSADSPVETEGYQRPDGAKQPPAGGDDASETIPDGTAEASSAAPDIDTPDVDTPDSIENGPSVDGFSGDVDLEDLDLDAESDGEADEASRGLFDDLLEGEPIFENKEVLRPSYTPERLPHREEQINNMATVLVSALRGDTPSNILIYGKTGTGKTASAKFVSEELETTSQKYEVPCEVEYINCEVTDTQYRVLAQLANKIGRAHV